MIGAEPHIAIERDGPLFRLAILPPDSLPDGWSRPETFSSRPLARMSARILSEATGFKVVDLEKENSIGR